MWPVLRWFVLLPARAPRGSLIPRCVTVPVRRCRWGALPVLLPVPRWRLLLGFRRWCSASPDFSVAAAGGAWCRSSSPCWCGRSGALGFYSMGKLRFCCCVCHRPRAGFGDAAGIGAGRDFLPLWYYLGFPAFCVGRWRWVARRPGGAVAAGRSAISCFSFSMVILI